MINKLLLIFFVSLIPFQGLAKDTDVPKDFRVIFQSSAGKLEKGTEFRSDVKAGVYMMERWAVRVGEGSERVKDNATDKISPEFMRKLYDLVVQSGFMDWPSSPDAPHASNVQQSFEITAHGKTVTRNRWEAANQERFRQFYQDYDKWVRDARNVGF